MSCSFLPGVAALALLPLAALARQPHPADAGAAVPATTYHSAFTDYRAAAADEASPDQIWRAANRAVAPADAQAAQTPPPGSRQPEAPRPDPHAGHGDHHTMQGK